MEGGRLNPLTLSFESRELEAQYWERYQPHIRRQTVVAVSTVLVLYSLFALLDPWIVPEILQPVWVIRAIVGLQCVLLILLTRTPLFKRAHQPLLGSLPVVGGSGILLMAALAGETGTQLYYAGLILAIIWMLVFADLRFVYAAPLALALIVGYEAIVILVKPLSLPVLVNNTFFLLGALVMATFAGYSIERSNRRGFYQSLLIEQERQRSEKLLLSILPKEISELLKSQSGTIANRYEEASILFADIVSFTPLSAQMAAEEMVVLLNEIFSYFDSLVEKYGVEKIRTIGDNYMVAAGVPSPRPDHARVLAQLALDMRAYADGLCAMAKQKIQFRIGINSGPVVAGVIGQKKFQYDVWGSTVNTASRMESQGEAGKIQITRATYELLKDEFICEPRGSIAVKGVGVMDTWFLVDRGPSLQRQVAQSPAPAPAGLGPLPGREANHTGKGSQRLSRAF